MRSSIIAFVFSISIMIIVFSYSLHLLILKKGILKSEDKITRSYSNSELLNYVNTVFKQNHNINYDLLKKELKKLEKGSIEIKIIDLSSNLNPNFMDFTLFKYPPLKGTLNKGTTWNTLNLYREKHGYTSTISTYDQFFKDGFNPFNIYTLPNINNVSDIELQKYYEIYTGNKLKAIQLRDSVVARRLSQQFLDENEYNNMLHRFDKEIQKGLDVIPSWNVNFVPEIVLKTILSKDYRGEKLNSYNEKIDHIIGLRKSRLISKEELHNILQLGKKQMAISTYLGVKTTFWQISINDDLNNLTTTLIYGWSIDRFRLVSLKTEGL